MRKRLLNVFLMLPLLGLVASAETPAPLPAGQRNELQRVNVVRGADEIRVEISAHGAVTPKVSAADSPSRLIVDLPGTVMATGQSRIPVDSAGVKGIRIAMDAHQPPTTRVVVDLEHALRYKMNASPDGKMVLTLYVQQAAQAASASVPKTVTPETKTNMTAQALVAPIAPATQKADAAPASSTSASSDFVFVEPKYEAKKQADNAAEPADRAQDAAA